MILKILTVALILAVMAIYAVQAMAEENQIEKYTVLYNDLCNVQMNNNIKADLPHATMNITMDDKSSARISASSLNYVHKDQNQVIEANLTPESSVISMTYEF